MSGFHLMDIPHIVPVRNYEDELSRMSEWLLQFPQVKSVYQVGSVGAPGISDLDVVVVCGNNEHLAIQPRNSLTQDGRYLFIHNLYGCSQEQFNEAGRFSFFGTFKLLSGKRSDDEALTASPAQIVKEQVALEFLLKMYVNLILQAEYKTLKVRSLLLHVKGLLFDLEFLGIQSGELYTLIHECMELRKNWFNQNRPSDALKDWFTRFLPVMKSFLEQQLQQRTFYVSPESLLRLSKNISLRKSNKLGYKRLGIPTLFFPSLLDKKTHRILNRFNRFQVQVPFEQSQLPKDIADYFSFVERCRKYNHDFLPAFYTLSSSLHV